MSLHGSFPGSRAPGSVLDVTQPVCLVTRRGGQAWVEPKQRPRDPRPSSATGCQELSFCLCLPPQARAHTWSMERPQGGPGGVWGAGVNRHVWRALKNAIFSPQVKGCASVSCHHPSSEHAGGSGGSRSGVWGPLPVPSLCQEGQGRQLH